MTKKPLTATISEDAQQLEENDVRRLPLGGDGVAQQRGISGRMHGK